MGLFYPEHLDRICCCARLGFSQNRMENLYGNGIGPVSEEQVPDFLAGKPAYAMGVNSKGMAGL